MLGTDFLPILYSIFFCARKPYVIIRLISLKFSKTYCLGLMKSVERTDEVGSTELKLDFILFLILDVVVNTLKSLS